MVRSYETDIFEKTVIDLLKDIKKELQDISSIMEPKAIENKVLIDSDISQEDAYNLIVKYSNQRQIGNCN